MEEKAPLPPRPYDPERWLRRWTTIWGGLLAIAILVPAYVPPMRSQDGALFASPRRTGWVWAWDLDYSTTWSGTKALLPYLLGIVAVVAVRRLRGKGKAVFVGLAALLEVALSMQRLADAVLMETPLEYVALFVAGALLLPLAAAAAATAHLTGRYPAASSIRRRSRAFGFAFAGLALAMGLAMLATGGRSSDALFERARLIALLPFVGAIGYGLVCGLRLQGAAENVRTLCVTVSTRLALPIWAGMTAAVSAWLRSQLEWLDSPEPATLLAHFVRHLGREGAPYALGALAFAAWVEPRLVALRRPDAGVLEPIFE